MTAEAQTPFGKLSWLTATAGGIGSLVPGWAYFNEQAPPSAEASGLVISAVALAVILYGINRPMKTRPTTGRALAWILAALVIVVAYGVARDYTTAAYPPGYELAESERNKRLQIGFALARWSLTAEAAERLRDPDVRTVDDLLLAFPGAYAGQVELVWTPLSVTAAGLLLLLLFSIGFLSWAYGFALLARALAD